MFVAEALAEEEQLASNILQDLMTARHLRSGSNLLNQTEDAVAGLCCNPTHVNQAILASMGSASTYLTSLGRAPAKASTPAWATSRSCAGVPELTPTAPTTAVSSLIGSPPPTTIKRPPMAVLIP